jgi:hypothetical protein
MRSSSYIVRPAALFAVLFALAPNPASANLFAPGEIKEVEQLGVPGTVAEDVLRPFTIDLGGGATIAGNVQDRIVNANDGRLSFVSYLRDITGSAGAVIESFSRGGFTGPLFSGGLDVTWSGTSIGVVEPSLGLRSADGSTMTFFFSPGIPLSPGGILGGNEHIAIHADAPGYALIGEMFIGARSASGDFGSTTLAVFAPVPEPAVSAMLLAGLAVVGWAGWRRSRTHPAPA